MEMTGKHSGGRSRYMSVYGSGMTPKRRERFRAAGSSKLKHSPGFALIYCLFIVQLFSLYIYIYYPPGDSRSATENIPYAFHGSLSTWDLHPAIAIYIRDSRNMFIETIGVYDSNFEEISPEELITELPKRLPDLQGRVYIACNPMVSYGEIIKIAKVCRSLGIDRIYLKVKDANNDYRLPL